MSGNSSRRILAPLTIRVYSGFLGVLEAELGELAFDLTKDSRNEQYRQPYSPSYFASVWLFHYRVIFKRTEAIKNNLVAVTKLVRNVLKPVF